MCAGFFELIQNADDTDFSAGVTPSFTVSLEGDRGLILHTNEDGLSYKNVDALCNLAKSSKTQPATGEKGAYWVCHARVFMIANPQSPTRSRTPFAGIGFKSVFMIANAVFVSSRSYTFSFDKRRQLGMVCLGV